jgi:hypothetical protein
MNRLFGNLLNKLSKAARASRGSTIVGVLAALVFITVVTSLMVKNTGAQAANSGGYGTAMTMQSTVMSGIVASEAVFGNSGTAEDVAKALDNYNKNKTSQFVPGLVVSGSNNKKALNAGSNQFFSSKILRAFMGAKKKVTVEINSGTKANGKGLKKGLAFYGVENLTTIPDPPTYEEVPPVISCVPNAPPPIPPSTGSENAVYMAGALRDGNNGMEVIGGATFEEEVRFQNKKAVFYGEAFFQKDVYFLADAGYVFYGNTYFNANVTFQNQPEPCQLFRDTQFVGNTARTYPKVGVNGNLTAFSTIQIPGSFYINGNGDLQQKTIKQNAISGSPSPAPKAYYTNNFTAGTAKFSNYATEKMDNNSNIPLKMNMKNLEERRETPLLSYSELKAKIGNITIDANSVTVSGTGSSGLSVDKLTAAFNTASATGKLYEGHLVVLLNYSSSQGGKYGEFKTHGLNGTTFEKKVIFLVESGTIASNGSFYCSSPASSTMIYVGENGRLQAFGSNCLFRGYIYIDEKNTSNDNEFYWGTGSSIEGAYHNFSTNPFKWNYNGDGNPTKITYNSAVLAPFNTLKKGYISGGNTDVTTTTETNSSGEECTTTTFPPIPHYPGTGSLGLEPGSQGLNPTPLGYYFY